MRPLYNSKHASPATIGEVKTNTPTRNGYPLLGDEKNATDQEADGEAYDRPNHNKENDSVVMEVENLMQPEDLRTNISSTRESKPDSKDGNRSSTQAP